MSEAEVEKRSQIVITAFLVLFWASLFAVGGFYSMVFSVMQGTYALTAIENGTWTGPEATNTYHIYKTIADVSPITGILLGIAISAVIIYKRRHAYAI